jgi:hypothetical protein
MMRAHFFIFTALLALAATTSATVATAQTGEGNDNEQKQADSPAFLAQPLLFEENRGQTDTEVRFLARSAGGVTYFFANNGVTIRLVQSPASNGHREAATEPSELKAHALRVSFAGANPCPVISAEERTPTVSNYLMGSDQSRWRNQVANYQKIRYHNIYDGIDLLYYGNGRQLEYDFIVHSGADPNVIRIKYEGAEGALCMAEDGSIAIATSIGVMNEMKPYVYQQTCEGSSHEQEIPAQWQIVGANGLQFALGDYDRTQTLYIDPLLYSTFIGGTGDEAAQVMDIDANGNAYITGIVSSSSFPTTLGAFDQTYNGSGWDVFVTKLNASGSSIVYSTFVGGGGNDWVNDFALDAIGNVYLTGFTQSIDFPTTVGAYDVNFNGAQDIFIAKLNASGSALVFSTFLGGRNNDVGLGIVLDENTNVGITGQTASPDYPTTPGSFDAIYNGGVDAFITKLNASGSSLVYSTFFGGNADDISSDILLDPSGNIYLTGRTLSVDFPTTASAFDVTYNGGLSYGDIFVTKFYVNCTSLIYSTFIGGSGDEGHGSKIALDANGNAFVASTTSSGDYPATKNAFNERFGGGGHDAVVTKLNVFGSALLYSTYIGGSRDDFGAALVLEPGGSANILGHTSSRNFPTTAGAYDTSYNGNADQSPDVFLSKLNAQGYALLYSTFIGGSGNDVAHYMCRDANANIYIAPGRQAQPIIPRRRDRSTRASMAEMEMLLSRK